MSDTEQMQKSHYNFAGVDIGSRNYRTLTMPVEWHEGGRKFLLLLSLGEHGEAVATVHKDGAPQAVAKLRRAS